MGMFEKVKSVASDAAAKASELSEASSEKMSGMLEAGAEKMKTTVDELNESMPLFGKLGYRVKMVEVELSANPKISLELLKERDVSEADVAEVLESAKEKKVVSTVAKAIVKANQMQAKLAMKGRTFKGLVIELGLFPAVKMQFL
jgi:hypothetical protein